ncbi:hypothetical protein A6R68_10126, partial [Neotoma lepida]
LYIMSKEESVSAVTHPGNVHVIEPPNAVTCGSQEKPLERTTYQTSATRLQYIGSANLQPPAQMIGLQAQPTGLQYSMETAGVQAQPGVIQCSPEITTVPEPTQTSSYPQCNMSCMLFPEFNPKKFINEEIRTLGGIQILIGLFHVVSAVNPQQYRGDSVLGISGYLVWGGLCVDASIGMNVLSSIFSLVGIIIIIVDLCISDSGVDLLTVSITADRSQRFLRIRRAYTVCLKAISGGLLPFTLLEFIITCVVSHVGCQAVCLRRFESLTVASTMFNGNTVNITNEPVNTTCGSVNMTNGPVNTTSPDYATNIPVQPSVRPIVLTMGNIDIFLVPFNSMTMAAFRSPKLFPAEESTKIRVLLSL